MLFSIRKICALFAILVGACTANVGQTVSAPCLAGAVESVAPLGAGPLKLARIDCIKLAPNHSSGTTPPALSPDGERFFTLDDGGGLWLGSLDETVPLQHFQADVGGMSAVDVRRPFAWFKDGHSVLAVTQDIMKPRGGWALGPLKPFLATVDGRNLPFPSLQHSAGPLDAIHWVGQEGRAIALFGTRGNSYRPKHADPRPTIALVDARAGRIIRSVPLTDLVPDASQTHINYVAWRIDKRAQIEALVSLAPGLWIFWSEGKKPRRVPIDINRGRPLFALTPDGRQVLVMRSLTATGWICERNPQCPPPTPTTGAIAELRDIRSGRVVWSISGTAKRFSNDGVPVISPNGRYGLISMPTGDHGYTAALIAMASGKLLQEIPSAGPHGSLMRFSADSQSLSISNNRRLATYRISE